VPPRRFKPADAVDEPAKDKPKETPPPK